MEKDTENKILRAAEEEFLAKGFLGARTTSIAEKAGVNHAMLHYYFRTKEKLFERIISEKVAMIGNIVAQSMDTEDKSVEGIIEKVIEKHLEFLNANPELPRFLIGELYSESERAEMLKEKIRKIAPEVIQRFQRILDAAAIEGKIIAMNARMLLIDIISLNVFPYLASPLVNTLLGNERVTDEAFLKERKQSNYVTIMKKLRP